MKNCDGAQDSKRTATSFDTSFALVGLTHKHTIPVKTITYSKLYFFENNFCLKFFQKDFADVHLSLSLFLSVSLSHPKLTR